MNIPTKIVIGGATIVNLVLITPLAFAAERSNSTSNLATAISQKFNLNPTDVKAVIDQVQADHQADRQASSKAKLDADVSAGKLTQTQEDLIVTKLSDEETFRASLKDLNQADRQTALANHKTEIKAWAKDNNIPLIYVMRSIRSHKSSR